MSRAIANMTEAMLIAAQSDMDWDYISKYFPFKTLHCLLELCEEIDFKLLARNKNINKDLRGISSYEEALQECMYENTLTAEFLVRHKVMILDLYEDYPTIMAECTLDESAIRYIQSTCFGADKKFWRYVFQNQKVSAAFIEEYIEHIENIKQNIHDYSNWQFISQHQDLSEEFINKYIDKLDMEFLFANQQLSDSFIERHANSEDLWNLVSYCQKLSVQFIIEHLDKIVWDHLFIMNKNLNLEIIRRFRDKIDTKTDYMKSLLKRDHSLMALKLTDLPDDLITNIAQYV